MLSHEPPGRGTMDSVLGRAFFTGGASITAAKMQVLSVGFPPVMFGDVSIPRGDRTAHGFAVLHAVFLPWYLYRNVVCDAGFREGLV